MLYRHHTTGEITETSDALLSALSDLNTLDTEQAQWRRAIIYLLLLVMHRCPVEEHEELITLIDQ